MRGWAALAEGRRRNLLCHLDQLEPIHPTRAFNIDLSERFDKLLPDVVRECRDDSPAGLSTAVMDGISRCGAHQQELTARGCTRSSNSHMSCLPPRCCSPGGSACSGQALVGCGGGLAVTLCMLRSQGRVHSAAMMSHAHACGFKVSVVNPQIKSRLRTSKTHTFTPFYFLTSETRPSALTLRLLQCAWSVPVE